MKCTNCGHDLPEDGKFCENCGAKIEQEPAPVTEPAVEAAPEVPAPEIPVIKKKPNISLIAALSTIGAVILAVVLFFVLSGPKTVPDKKAKGIIEDVVEILEDDNVDYENYTAVYGPINREPEFVKLAFTVADDMLKKHGLEDQISLFYNDYNSFNPVKRDKICNLIIKPLMEEKLIDGMGMQGHLVLGDSSLQEIETALHKYGSFGLDIHVTELDVHCTDASAEGQKVLADYYKDLFRIYLDAKKKGLANLACVTFWGMKDDESWLTGFRKERSYPLLFGDAYEKKQAYEAVVSLADEF